MENLFKTIKNLETCDQDEIIGDYFRLRMGSNPIHQDKMTGIIAKLLVEKVWNASEHINLSDIIMDEIKSNSGIYGIMVDNYLVYVGRSKNLEVRWKQHIKGIENASEKKYELLREALQYGYTIRFIVLEYCDESELKEKEKQNILQYKCPPLNSDLPSGRRAIADYSLKTMFQEVQIIYHDLFGFVARDYDKESLVYEKTEQ